MWYFSWILGVAFASSFAVLFGVWFEFKNKKDEEMHKDL